MGWKINSKNVVYLYRRINNDIPTAEVTSRPLTMIRWRLIKRTTTNFERTEQKKKLHEH